MLLEQAIQDIELLLIDLVNAIKVGYDGGERT